VGTAGTVAGTGGLAAAVKEAPSIAEKVEALLGEKQEAAPPIVAAAAPGGADWPPFALAGGLAALLILVLWRP